MTFWGPVAARQLHRRRVRLRDRLLLQASLFPFFDGEGRVKASMLVWPDSESIVLLPHRPRLFRVPLLSDVTLRSDHQALVDTNAERATEITAGCWHYDPWWLLREPRFHGHSAVPVLKATNCVQRFVDPVRACYFSRDLSRLEALGLEEKGSTDSTLVPFEPAHLPERPATVPLQRRRAASWRLDPFWQRRRTEPI